MLDGRKTRNGREIQGARTISRKKISWRKVNRARGVDGTV